jgi:dsDNA-binding SOS-regulon protein
MIYIKIVKKKEKEKIPLWITKKREKLQNITKNYRKTKIDNHSHL